VQAPAPRVSWISHVHGPYPYPVIRRGRSNRSSLEGCGPRVLIVWTREPVLAEARSRCFKRPTSLTLRALAASPLDVSPQPPQSPPRSG
jgi:hypothetical protein